MFCNREKRCVVLAWRGTEQLKWKDLLTDVRLAPTGFNVERVRSARDGRTTRAPVRTPALFPTLPPSYPPARDCSGT